MLESDDDIACILGHEMAHQVLRHDVDKASRAHLLEILTICLGSFIWLIIPDDLCSFAIQMFWFVTFCVDVEYYAVLPYPLQLDIYDAEFLYRAYWKPFE